MKLHIDQRFARIALQRFIDIYYSEAFNHAVAPVSGLKARTLVEERALADGRRERRVRMEPAVTIPSPIDRLIGKESISYDEVSTFDPARNEATWRIDSKAGDRVKVSGTIRFVDDPRGGEPGVRRVIDGDIEVKAPIGLGGLIERFIEAETQKGYAKIAEFMQRYCDSQPPP